MQILVVDDNVPLAQNIAEILECEGHRVTIAACAQEALEVARRTSYDGAVLDVCMPGMDGVDLFAELQQLHPEAIYCLMTAYSVDSRIEKALASGAKSVLSKPLSVDELLKCVKGAGRAKVLTTNEDLGGVEFATS